MYWVNANEVRNMADVFLLDITNIQTFINDDKEIECIAECNIYLRSRVELEQLGHVAQVLRKAILVNDDTTTQRIEVNRKNEQVKMIAGGLVETSMQFTYYSRFEFNKSTEPLRQVKFN